MTTDKASAAAQGNEPGKISDALTGFLALAAKFSAEPTPDPNVAAAYGLGWVVGEALTCASHQTFEHLPAVPGLTTAADQWKLLVHQIISRCGTINAHLKDVNSSLDLSAQVGIAGTLQLDPADKGQNPASDDEVKGAVHAKETDVAGLHKGILGILWSAESSLGKAYSLGHEMEQMCTDPIASKSSVKVSVGEHGPTIRSLLCALASKLPANAAHATDNSLLLWSASLGAGGEESPADLLDQGQRWHDVLVGDVAGKDGLRLSDYVAAADSVTGKLWAAARKVLARFRIWLLVVLVVALAGIGLIIWGTRGALSAGIVSLVAAFGLTWKGIGELFGRAAAKGEQELWDAEIDWAIAYRFTTLRNGPTGKKLKGLKCDQPIKDHLQRYNNLKQTWPDTDPPKA